MQLESGVGDVSLSLAVESIHEVGVEDLPGEVEGVTLQVDERDQKVDYFFGRELGEFLLQNLLHYLPELEAVRRMEVEFAKGSAGKKDNLNTFSN